MAQQPTPQRLDAARAPERCLIWGVLQCQSTQEPAWHLAVRRCGGRWVDGDFLLIAHGWWAPLPQDPPAEQRHLQPDRLKAPDQGRLRQPA